jgi:hypothetical protein
MNWRGRPLTSHEVVSPALAWLCHPALTGMPATEWDALVTTLMTLHERQREPSLDKRRGHRPPAGRPGSRSAARPHPGRPAPGRCTALPPGLSQVAIGVLLGVRPETVSKRLRDIRELLDQASTTIQPGPRRLASLEELYDLARSTEIDLWVKIKSACYFPASS